MDYEGVIEEGCETLGVGFEEDLVVDLRNLNAKISELFGFPLVTAQCSPAQLEALEKINKEFLEEYTFKRQNMLSRFDNYMKLINGNSRLPKDVIRDVFEIRNSLSPLPTNHLEDISKPSTNSSLIFSFLEKTSPINVTTLDEKTLASGIFPLRFAPTKPPKSNGKKKKEELKVKRSENPKPVPKREKNMKKREKLQSNDQEKPEDLSLAQRKANKAEKKKQKREARKERKNQPKHPKDQQDDQTQEDQQTEEHPKDQQNELDENEDDKEEEQEDDESVSHRSEGEFIDSHSDEDN
eukprot:TRINITY_DN4027_c0_g1_i1.p2 TRINITY_DN4027_c0_g1~~TRINITY_DN4027_c0_g1_i1.p2  ORF type:complete len:296 (+),score=111.07 TRINITY_DN4027_c0_g1_i1:768-1655(+)